MTESLTAFELLLQIDQRCRLLAADLPSQPTRQDSWSGIGFRLGEHWYVAPMGEVSAICSGSRRTTTSRKLSPPTTTRDTPVTASVALIPRTGGTSATSDTRTRLISRR